MYQRGGFFVIAFIAVCTAFFVATFIAVVLIAFRGPIQIMDPTRITQTHIQHIVAVITAIRPTYTHIYINKFHIVNIAFIAFFGPSFAFAAAAFLVAALAWTGHARGCKATRALTSQRVAVITATYPLKKTILISTCRPTMPLHDRLSYWSALGKSSLSAPPNCWGAFSLQRQRHQGRRLQRQRLPQRLQ